MDKTQDLGGKQSAPEGTYKKYFHDLPKEYCCKGMREGIEEIEFIQYCAYYDEYSFSSYDGYPLTVMRYCPYCGKEIESLRALLSVIQFRYMKEKGWEIEDVDRYWGLFREGKSQEEAERIVEQERRSLPVQE
jgi:hypothetical protein